MPVRELRRGQTFRLVYDDGRPVAKLRWYLSWDRRPEAGVRPPVEDVRREIDLDATCIMFDARYREIDAAWWQHLQSNDGSVSHAGDELVGDNDELITVDLARMPSGVEFLVATITSYRGHGFDEIFATCKVVCSLLDYSSDTEQEILSVPLAEEMPRGGYTAIVLAILQRSGAGWLIRLVGELGYGKTYRDLLALIRHQLQEADR